MMCSHRTLFARCLRWLTQRYAITRSFIALFVAMPAGLLFNFQETTQEKQENKKIRKIRSIGKNISWHHQMQFQFIEKSLAN